MKSLKLAIAILLASTVASHAANLEATKGLIANSIIEYGALADVNNSLRIDVLKGEKAINEMDNNLQITKVEFDTANNSFRAFISANNKLPVEITGQFREITKIPVLAKKLSKEQVIAKEDISYMEIEASKLRNGYITSADALIGKSPVRAIYKARPISPAQISAPQVIERNKQVTMVFKNNALRIEDIGIAMEDASAGDIIKFRNASSKRIVRGRVIDGQTAEIISQNSALASN